jgi:hypothetical protein
MATFFSFMVLVIVTSCDSGDKLDFSAFDNFTSLTLKAYFHDDTDCGEWGGHSETMSIVERDNKLIFSYKQDSSRCLIRSLAEKKLSSDIKRDCEGELSTEKQKLVADYVKEVYSYDPSKYSLSNAPDYYSVELKGRFTTRIFRIDYTGDDWRKFEELRNKILND